MTKIKLFIRGNKLSGIESAGHSDPIVCAAVSALMQALILGVTEVAGLDDENVKLDRKNTLIRVTWPEDANISILTDTIAESLKEIAKENPRHVKIYTEVTQ